MFLKHLLRGLVPMPAVRNPSNTPGCIETFSGKYVDPLHMRESDLCIADMGHALANICRFSGHCRTFYSVAEHSVRMYQLANKEFSDVFGVDPYEAQEAAVWSILHDAAEVYLCDIPRPLKRNLPRYKKAEKRIQALIAKRYKLDPELYPVVHILDDWILRAEARDLMPSRGQGWNWATAEAQSVKTIPLLPDIGWEPKRAKAEWMKIAIELRLDTHERTT